MRTFAALVVLGLAVSAPVSAQSTPDAPQTWDPFFDNTVLHEIRLAVNSRDWQSLKDNYLGNTYYTCDFRWKGKGEVLRNVGIRNRGVGSRTATRPGLNVHFDHYVTGQHFLGLKSFVLRNNFNVDPGNEDRSYLHETLSMLLFKRLGHPAPREAHTKLFVNNNYIGLYRIVQSLDEEFLQETFNEHGGYLYKYDYPADAKPYYFEDRGPDPKQYVPLPFKPETHQTDPRPEFVAQWIQTINSDVMNFSTAILDYLDPGSFIRHVAVENFLADIDGFLGNWGVNNMDVYRPENTKQFVFIGWDMGKTFLGGVEYDIFQSINKDVPDAQKNRLMTRMLADSDFRNQYLEALLACVRSVGERAPDGRNWMEGEIWRQYNLIRDAALTDPTKPFSNPEFEQAVSDALMFVQRRGDSVTRQVSDARAAQQ